MTREESRKAAEVMLAYADGKDLQIGGQGSNEWVDVTIPFFNWELNSYRVRPETTYRPSKDAKECFEEMQKHEPFGWVYADLLNEFNGALMQITLINNKGYRFVTDRKDRSYSDAFEINSVYFADGTPFGIKEEE